MYKEVVKSAKKTLYIVIGAVIAALLLLSFIDVLFIYFNVPYQGVIQLVLIALLTAVVYLLLSREISDYQYFFIEDELIFIKKLGNREAPILHITTSELEFIAPEKSEAASQSAAKTYSAQKSLFGKKIFVGYYNRDGKRYRFKFEPSDNFISVLERNGVKVLN